MITEAVMLAIRSATLVLVLALGSSGVMAKTPSKLLKKAFFTAERIKDQSPEALARLFEKSPPKGEIRREAKGRWQPTMVAFFAKKSVDGPVTIWLFDKADKDQEPIQALSVDAKPTEIFVHELDIDPDLGYNAGHTYLVKVGQIVAKKERIYAAGELKLVK
jgi:hypothetical protein